MKQKPTAAQLQRELNAANKRIEQLLQSNQELSEANERINRWCGILEDKLSAIDRHCTFQGNVIKALQKAESVIVALDGMGPMIKQALSQFEEGRQIERRSCENGAMNQQSTWPSEP